MFDSTTEELRAVERYLQWVLDNLEYIQNIENPRITIYSDELNDLSADLSFVPEYGLCDNILYCYLYKREIHSLFITWGDFSGSTTYPCGDGADFQAVEPINLYLNPKRISLIRHIVECLNNELEVRDE